MAGRTIGLDLGVSGVRAAQLHFGRGGATLERLGQVELPAGAVCDGEVVDPPAVAAALRQLWAATRLGRRGLVLGISSPRVDVRFADLPKPTDSSPAHAGQHRQGRRATAGPRHTLLDFLPVPQPENTASTGAASTGAAYAGSPSADGVPGLLVAAPRVVVEAALTALDLAGLHPVGVDVASLALLRAMGRTEEIGLGVPVEALVDIGGHVTTLVVHVAGIPRFVRVLRSGGRDVTEAIRTRLAVSGPDAESIKQRLPTVTGTSGLLAGRVAEAAVGTLVHQVSAALEADRAQGNGPAVHRITLTGGGSALAVLPERLRAATGIPVDRGGPLDALRLGRTGLSIEQVEQLAPRMAVSVGLALGGPG